MGRTISNLNAETAILSESCLSSMPSTAESSLGRLSPMAASQARWAVRDLSTRFGRSIAPHVGEWMSESGNATANGYNRGSTVAAARCSATASQSALVKTLKPLAETSFCPALKSSKLYDVPALRGRRRCRCAARKGAARSIRDLPTASGALRAPCSVYRCVGPANRQPQAGTAHNA